MKFDHPIQSPIDVITGKAVTKRLPMLDIIEQSAQQQNVKATFYNSGSTGEDMVVSYLGERFYALVCDLGVPYIT